MKALTSGDAAKTETAGAAWDTTPTVQLVVVIPEARRFLLPSIFTAHKNFARHYPADAITLTLVETAPTPLKDITARVPKVDYLYINSTRVASQPPGDSFCEEGHLGAGKPFGCCPLPGDGRFLSQSSGVPRHQGLRRLMPC